MPKEIDEIVVDNKISKTGGKIAFLTPLWNLGKYIAVWFALWVGPFSVCPHCGTAGCIVGGASAGVLAGVVTFFMHIVRKISGKKPANNKHMEHGNDMSTPKMD